MLTKEKKLELISRARAHIAKQGVLAVDPDNHECKYRMLTSRGEELRCAVGALIPDELLTPELVKKNPRADALHANIIAAIVGSELFDVELLLAWDLLKQIQGCHDRVARDAGSSIPIDEVLIGLDELSRRVNDGYL